MALVLKSRQQDTCEVMIGPYERGNQCEGVSDMTTGQAEVQLCAAGTSQYTPSAIGLANDLGGEKAPK